MSIAGVAAGLVANLSKIVPDVQVLPGPIAEPTPPTIWPIIPGQGGLNYHIAQGRSGGMEFECTVQGFTPYTNDLANIATLYSWLDNSGPASIAAAIESDRTLGGAAEDLAVGVATGPVVATIGSGPVLLAEWTVTIYMVTL